MDDKRPVFRPDRFFCSGGFQPSRMGWFYEAREGIQGPFETREAAEEHLEALKNTHSVSRAQSRRSRQR